MNELSSLLETLNPQQKEAVTLPTTVHAAILSGAGTGKTRVLTLRIAYLISQGVNPAKILAFTFTNKAAEEMQRRLSALVSKADAKAMRVGTFHGIGLRILRAFGKSIGLDTKRMHVWDEDLGEACLRKIAKNNGWDKDVFKEREIRPSTIYESIQKWKELGMMPSDVSAIPHWKLSEEQQLAALWYPEYEQEIRSQHGLDFPDLIGLPIRILSGFPDILSKVQSSLSHILVDEYQDTNAQQMELLRLLGGGSSGARVFVVGDDDQSIYGFRGSEPEVFPKFLERYQEIQKTPNGQTFHKVSVVRLEQNYRCNKKILEAANAVIGTNKKRMEKTLFTDDQSISPVSWRHFDNKENQGKWIAENILQIKKSGVRFSEIAILYRKNSSSRFIESALIQHGIPYKIYGASFFDRIEIKDALAWLRILRYPENDASLSRAMKTPNRGIGEKALELLESQAGTGSLWEALQSFRGATDAKGKKFADFLAQVEEFQSYGNAVHWSVPMVISKIYEKLSLKEYYSKKEKEVGDIRGENLDELLFFSRNFHQRYSIGEIQLDDFSNNFSEPLPDNEMDVFLLSIYLEEQSRKSKEAENDAVQVMTVHRSKGLEFQKVFICSFEDGEFPSIKDGVDMEEERRIFYVAMTRAKSQLFLSFLHGAPKPGRSYALPPSFWRVSRFFWEIPDSCLTLPKTALPDVQEEGKNSFFPRKNGVSVW